MDAKNEGSNILRVFAHAKKSLSVFFFLGLFLCLGLRDTLWCIVYLCMHRASFFSETDHYILISVCTAMDETAAYVLFSWVNIISPSVHVHTPDGGEGRYQAVYSLPPGINVSFVADL